MTMPGELSKSTKPKDSTIRLLVAGLLVITLVFLSLAGLSLYQSRIHHEERVFVTANNLAGLLGQSIGDIIKKIDELLLSMVDDVQDSMAAGGIDGHTIDRLSMRHLTYVPELRKIRMTDRKGEIVYGVSQAGLMVSDRDYYIRLRDDPKAGLVISKPIVSRIDGEWVLVLARRFNGPDGSFAGVLFGSIALEHFNELLASVDIGNHGGISLRDGEMGIIARHPAPKDKGAIIGNKVLSPELRKLFEAGQPSGTFFTPTSWDNVAKVVSYRKIGEYPLYVNVGVAADDYLPEWRRESLRVLLLGALFLLVVLSFAWSLYHDISERKKKTEETLRVSQEKYRSIFQASNVGIAFCDIDGGIIAANQAFEQLSGCGRHEMIGMNIKEFAPSELQHLRDLAEGRRDKFRLEGRFIRKDSSVAWSDLSISVIRTADNRPEYFIAVFSDITERKYVEEERLRLERQVQQMQKAESLGRMAGAIAHHFNNMLAVVTGNLELVYYGLPQRPNLREHIADALKASGRAAEISRSMLVYLGQTASTKESIDLAGVLNEALLLIRASLPKKVRLEISPPSEELMILADADHIKQILMNLILNASEAIGEQDGVITVAIRPVIASDVLDSRHFPLDWKAEAQCYACVSVADTGCGMDEAIQEKIFDPFFSTKFAGRGLGLSVAIGLVRAHEGAMALESRPGEGSTFLLYLPMPETPQPPARKMETPVSTMTEERGLVLLVEDEPMVRNMAESMLKHLGYEVITACDGSEAVDIFREHGREVDLAIIDLTMPRMNGWETIAELRALRPDLQVILTSGYDEAKAMQGHHLEIPQAFLHKPYVIKDLKAALGAAQKRRPSQTGAPEKQGE